MTEQVEANETLSDDQIVDKVFEAHEAKEKETPSAPSAETKPEGSETETKEPTEPDSEKTEKVKEVEDDASLSVEDKIAKIKDILDSDEAVEAYIKSKGYHTDPAWIKQRELIDRLKEEAKSPKIDDETKGKLELLDKVLSNPDFIKAQMKTDGFTDEAINNKLRELGHEVAETRDDVQLVTQKLGLDIKTLTPETKDLISDVSKIADVILQDRLKGHLKPLEEGVTQITQASEAGKMLNGIKQTVQDENILDFDKDIEPEIQKFMDENPEAEQPQIQTYFNKINHELSIERLRTGKKKGEREEKKGDLRSSKPGVHIAPGKLPDKTGNFDEDADALLDSLNIK